MKFSHSFQSILFKCFLSLIGIIPFPLLSTMLMGTMGICYRLGLRRRVVMTNLRIAFGKELPEKELKNMAHEFYRDLGRTVAEIAKPEHLIHNVNDKFQVRGMEILEKELESGKGVVGLTGHLGNVPAAAYYLKEHGYNFNAVIKQFHNESAFQEFVRFFERFGASLISVTGYSNDPSGGLKIYRTLKKGEIVVILNDQDAGGFGYTSTFFGIPTSIPSGPARFAFRSGASIITGFTTRKHGKIVIDIQGPIDYSGAKNEEEAEQIILDEYTRRLEEKVREVPEQYFWLHKKWKAQPEIRSRYQGD